LSATVAVDHAGLAETFRSEHATLYDLEHAGDPDPLRKDGENIADRDGRRSDDPFEVERVGGSAEGLRHREVEADYQPAQIRGGRPYAALLEMPR
jgi:hypothetical protein